MLSCHISVDALEIKKPCFVRSNHVSELCMRLLQLDLGEDLATRGERFWKAIMDPVSHHVWSKLLQPLALSSPGIVTPDALAAGK